MIIAPEKMLMNGRVNESRIVAIIELKLIVIIC